MGHSELPVRQDRLQSPVAGLETQVAMQRGGRLSRLPDRIIHTQSVAQVQHYASAHVADCMCHTDLTVRRAIPFEHKNFRKNKSFGTLVARIAAAAPRSHCRLPQLVRVPMVSHAIRMRDVNQVAVRAEIEWARHRKLDPDLYFSFARRNQEVLCFP